jgi:hypothetical protein
MAKRTITEYSCDMCKDVVPESALLDYKGPVLFTTEQTEGRGVKPYYQNVGIDLCNRCMEKSVTIKAAGAQGFNEYWVHDKKEEARTYQLHKREKIVEAAGNLYENCKGHAGTFDEIKDFINAIDPKKTYFYQDEYPEE